MMRSVRPGHPGDLPVLLELLAEEAQECRRDSVPGGTELERRMAGFDWESRSRVIEGRGRPVAVALVTARETADGTVARVEVAGSEEGDRLALLRWGLGLGRAAGARVGQVWQPQGHRECMAELGLLPARPFWRMDRPHLEDLPPTELPAEYQLAEGPPWRVAAETYNRAFEQHWRHSPLSPDAPPEGRPRDLDLLAVTSGGQPAAVAWGEVEEHDERVDRRRQPVGVVGVVGTVPSHRRRGLGSALTAEALRRLRGHGARSASLYVDGLNPTRAYDVYRRLGFEVAYEYEVFEVRW
jgi:ribosomal protein S18 acetylase RimI-like enzyme